MLFGVMLMSVMAINDILVFLQTILTDQDWYKNRTANLQGVLREICDTVIRDSRKFQKNTFIIIFKDTCCQKVVFFPFFHTTKEKMFVFPCNFTSYLVSIWLIFS